MRTLPAPTIGAVDRRGVLPLHQARTVLGLLGRIGAGKSHVARMAATLGHGVLVDADQLASDVLEAAARDGRLSTVLGPGLCAAEGEPDRAAIAELVFTDEDALRRLEALLHPEVLAHIVERLDAHARGAGAALLVLDVPLLSETGLTDRCNALWYVEVDESTRLARAARRGLDAADIRRRERTQHGHESKRARADLVIQNDDDPTAQVQAGLRALGLLSPPPPSHDDGR